MSQRLVFRVHALKRMFQRKISIEDVRHIVETGRVIEDYPDALPYPSQLILGWIGERLLHAVISRIEKDSEIIVVTVYEPRAEEWEEGFTRRKK